MGTSWEKDPVLDSYSWSSATHFRGAGLPSILLFTRQTSSGTSGALKQHPNTTRQQVIDFKQIHKTVFQKMVNHNGTMTRNFTAEKISQRSD